MSENEPTVTRRTVLKASGSAGALALGSSPECGILDRLRGKCSGSGSELLRFASRADHPDDADVGEGNVAIYAHNGVIHKKVYGEENEPLA